MRVISGTQRGRRLFSQEGLDVRPTTDKVKESLFSIIQFDIPDSTVLDLFAGSGQLGIEALSRGAKEAVFVDSSKKSIETVRRNIEATGFGAKSKVVFSDSFSFLSSTNQKFDIAILDPPYEKGLCDKAFTNLSKVMNMNAIVICETRANETLEETFGDFGLYREYVYSNIKISLFRNNN